MFDMSKPIPFEVVLGGIAIILLFVAIGLGLVWFYKRKI